MSYDYMYLALDRSYRSDFLAPLPTFGFTLLAVKNGVGGDGAVVRVRAL